MRKLQFLFILSSLILFLPTRRYGMVTDFINWMSRYDNGTTSDLWICFGYPGLHHFFHLINYSFFSVFGTNEWAWYFLASILHGINAYLVFRLSEALLKLIGSKVSKQIPLIIGILFLCMPYNVEAVVWKACIHYLITTGLIIQSLRWLIEYLKKGENKYLIFVFTAFLLSLFSLELSFIVPLLSLALILFIKYSTETEIDLGSSLKKVVLSQLLMLISYLVLSRWAIGNFIGHYGADKHFNLNPDLIFGNGLKYLSKYLIHPHFFDGLIKFAYYEALSQPVVYIPTILVITGSIFLGFFKWKKLSPELRLSCFMLIVFAVALAPILTLYFSHTLLWENDRYGYLASAFFIPFLVLLLLNIPWKPVAKSLLVVWTGFTLFFFARMITHCYNAGKLQHALLDNFKIPDKANDLFILSSPDNYKGLLLFRDYDTKGDFIRKSLKYLKGVEFENKIHHVSQFNAVNMTDAIKVRLSSDKEFIIGFNQYGNWFWKHGIGLSSYETKEFNVRKNRYNLTCEIKHPKPNDYIFYSGGLRWEGRFFNEFELTDHPTGDAK